MSPEDAPNSSLETKGWRDGAGGEGGHEEDAAGPSEQLRALQAEHAALKAAHAAQDARIAAAESELAALQGHGRVLEKKLLDLLESRSWRLLEPARRLSRKLTGRTAPKPFTPRFLDPAEAGDRRRGGGLARADGRTAAAALIRFADARDWSALLAEEAGFAVRESADDQAFFLRRFSRLLALKRLSAFSEAVDRVDAIETRFGERRDWLLETFGARTYVRYVGDASTALARAGRYADARRLVDPALVQLDNDADLLRHRAELSWPYAPEEARADLETAARRDRPTQAATLLGAYLAMRASDGAADLEDRIDAHPQMRLVAAAAGLRRGDFAAYRRHFNGYFEAEGLTAPLPATAERFGFEDLVRRAPGDPDGPLVSVVMTTYNSLETLDYAIGSLLGQTYGNLDILIVDDGSTDGTRDRLAALEAGDPRVRVLLNDENIGTYCSKNRAIARAWGEYVTLHDSDDWAHPERIARHVAMMETQRSLVATRSEWLRVEEDGTLHFRRWGCKFKHPNPASTFFRRRILDEIGFFDSVRYGADSEFWFRLNKVYGGRVKSLPLCLGLGHIRADSLTQSGSGAMDRENYSPVRGAYAASYLEWHATAPRAALKLPPRLESRPFPAPEEMIVPGPGATPGPIDAPAPAAAVANALPEVMFGISLASQRVSSDWRRTEELLGHTLRSLLNQSDPRFSVVICGHERPRLGELADRRVLFVESDQGPPRNPAGFRGDKMRKRRIVGSILRERGGGYFFPLDADDLVHRDVVAHVRADDNRKGYLIDRGYALDYGNRVLATIPGAWSVSFDRSCGSSALIYFRPDELPNDGEMDPELYFNLFQSHAYWPLVAEEYDRRLEPLPFPAGVYVVNHAQNLSFRLQRKGLRTENIVRSIARHRVEDGDAIMQEEFGWNAG